MSPAHFAAAAEALAGTRFRLGGRVPAHGLDCVGLVACALGTRAAPAGYGLRNASIARHLAFAQAAGFHPAAGPARPGDLLLAEPGPAQHHLLVMLDADRFVHAHAGLGRVVVQPGPPDWPIAVHWRLATQDI